MYKNYKCLQITRDAQVLTVRMNNPPLNAATYDLHDELSHVFYDIAQDDCAAVILTGEGRCFSAGGDFDDMQRNLEDGRRLACMMERAPHIVHSILALDTPLIAKVNGHAMGLGATLALLCDVVIMNDAARIGDPHVNIGLSAGDGGSLLWPLLVGYARARHHLLTGTPLTAPQAEEIGLIHKAVPLDLLDAEVAAYVDTLLALPQLGVRMTKRSINLALTSQLKGLVQAHAHLEHLTLLSEDHAEAISALRDKRPARYVNR